MQYEIVVVRNKDKTKYFTTILATYAINQLFMVGAQVLSGPG